MYSKNRRVKATERLHHMIDAMLRAVRQKPEDLGKPPSPDLEARQRYVTEQLAAMLLEMRTTKEAVLDEFGDVRKLDG